MIRNYPITFQVNTENETVSLVVGAEKVATIELDEKTTTLDDLRALLGVKS